jgi:hypothetical protein
LVGDGFAGETGSTKTGAGGWAAGGDAVWGAGVGAGLGDAACFAATNLGW